LEPVEGTALDCRTAQSLGAMIDRTGGLDRYWLFDAPGDEVQLAHPASGRRLKLSTSAPGAQVYTGNSLTAPYGRFGGICIEPHGPPNAVHRGGALLRPGERCVWRTVYAFDGCG